jgi:hypothetical protein
MEGLAGVHNKRFLPERGNHAVHALPLQSLTKQQE